MGVAKRVLDGIMHEHLDAYWWSRVPLEVVRRNARICHAFKTRCLIKEYLGIVVEKVFRAFPSAGREQGGSEDRASL